MAAEKQNNKKEIVKTVDVKLNSLDAKYGYSLKKINDYDFAMDVYTEGVLDLTTTIYLNNMMKETISGTLSQMKVGVQTNYNLHDRSTDIEAYVVPTPNNYQHYIEKEIDINQWELFFNMTPTTPNKNISMTKSYRRRIW